MQLTTETQKLIVRHLHGSVFQPSNKLPQPLPVTWVWAYWPVITV